MQFIIMQWNACSISAHSGELKHFLSGAACTPDIICISETHLKPKHTIKFEGYAAARKDRVGEQRWGGVAIFAKDGIVFKVLDTLADIECIGIEILINGKTFNIINVYNPPSSDIDAD